MREKRFIFSEAAIDVNMIMAIGKDTAKANGKLKDWFTRLKPDHGKKT